MDICSELRNNPGGSVTNSADVIAAEVIAAGVIRANELPTPLIWIEHRPEESTNGGKETFDLVMFSSYKVEESTIPRGDENMEGDATWKRLDHATVEVLVGGKV